MKFFFPDSSDHVDPSFDFESETRSTSRIRQRDDLYAHEIFADCPYDGLLISKSIVELGTSRYTEAQRQRLLRQGAPGFLRTTLPDGRTLPVLGDCGAFSYVSEAEPPFTVDEVLQFYTACRVDFGISVDHVILQYEPGWDRQGTLWDDPQATEAHRRQSLTLDRAREFLTHHRQGKLSFTPVGAAQGWSPSSYAESVSQLQKIGFSYIALGGLVPLKTKEILQVLAKVDEIRRPTTTLHLLGVARCENLPAFAGHGVVSFDSTSPLLQAFKDMRDNYYVLDGAYPAIRVPQVDANLTLKRRIGSGVVSQEDALRLERRCLEALLRFDRSGEGLDETVDLLAKYETIRDPKSNRSVEYRQVLVNAPWRNCPCEVCRSLGIHVIIFRGAERNRRRGFHNLWVFRRRLDRELTPTAMSRTQATKTT